MSPTDRNGPVTGTNFALGSYEKFQPGFRYEKRPNILATDEQTWRNTNIITLVPIIALATLKVVSLQLNGMLMMWKIQQANARLCNPDRQNSSCFHLGNRAEVFIWKSFQPTYRHPGWKNRDLGNRASPPSHKNTSKILQ